ncbi:ATP-binding protein [Novisyntrophococcus fermenticellae]|uniref:ATP-binding protein n=1 Tax=Novisyntrophococcus fermenticellae TaxID=2068655 RepID=UPI001E3F4C46|nr:sensor histidine kinase [Novisyntrophococcus fermenticellae]
MNSSDLMDTPRIFTAIAEWAACMIYILLLPKKLHQYKLGFSLTGTLGVLLLYQYIAGLLPLYLWIPGMIGAIAIMYFSIYFICHTSFQDAAFCCIRAFVLAEFAASLQWQLYVWWADMFQKNSILVSVMVMLLTYLFIYTIYFLLERSHIPADEPLDVNRRELIGAASIAIGAFAISNISFVMPDTPFSSATSSLLYIRTLVDFGGLVMLFAHQDKREEFRMRTENQNLNNLLQRQYDHYKMAQENLQILRRETHDLKHYLLAIRSEENPEKREQYLYEMEHALQVQEAFADTGNHVLDVVLTTKTTYCVQHNITFNCLADGKLINFMHVKDICSIFGNALDNAIECVRQFENPEKRLITLNMFQKKQFLIIQFENYTENPPVTKDKFPETTKNNKLYHGYGLKSIQIAVKKYDGTMTLKYKPCWFQLKILIPVKT